MKHSDRYLEGLEGKDREASKLNRFWRIQLVQKLRLLVKNRIGQETFNSIYGKEIRHMKNWACTLKTLRK